LVQAIENGDVQIAEYSIRYFNKLIKVKPIRRMLEESVYKLIDLRRVILLHLH